MERNKILIVEDEPIVARNLQKRLMNLGFRVPALAATAEQAIQEAERTHPDLVLMDIRLEGEGDGIAAAREIHERLGIPVVYVTAYADADTVRRAKVAEPLGFLPKPFGLRELQTTIEVALHKHGVDMRRRESERVLSAALGTIREAVIAVDAGGIITHLNPAGEALTGIARRQAVGRALAEVLCVAAPSPDRRAPDWANAALHEGRFDDLCGQVVIRSANGHETPVTGIATPLRDERGENVGTVLVFDDLSERRRAEEALREDERRYEELRVELDAALDRLEALRRLLPICASCHRVRDAQGKWRTVDALSDAPDAAMDGTICPDCSARLRSTPPIASD